LKAGSQLERVHAVERGIANLRLAVAAAFIALCVMAVALLGAAA
jgi:hypothetical protein